MTSEQLRKIDQTVLHQIQEGKDDTQKIKQATTLDNPQIRYSLKKLQKLSLINLEKPDGMVERTINGQKRVFKQPLQAKLTEKGRKYDYIEVEEMKEYEDLNREELVRKVHQLETRIEDLEQTFQTFRTQVRTELSKN